MSDCLENSFNTCGYDPQALTVKQLDVQNLAVLPLRVSPQRICFLKFILEAYDGLAVLSTVDARQGEVELRCFSESFSELTELVDALYSELI